MPLNKRCEIVAFVVDSPQIACNFISLSFISKPLFSRLELNCFYLFSLISIFEHYQLQLINNNQLRQSICSDFQMFQIYLYSCKSYIKSQYIKLKAYWKIIQNMEIMQESLEISIILNQSSNIFDLNKNYQQLIQQLQESIKRKNTIIQKLDSDMQTLKRQHLDEIAKKNDQIQILNKLLLDFNLKLKRRVEYKDNPKKNQEIEILKNQNEILKQKNSKIYNFLFGLAKEINQLERDNVFAADKRLRTALDIEDSSFESIEQNIMNIKNIIVDFVKSQLNQYKKNNQKFNYGNLQPTSESKEVCLLNKKINQLKFQINDLNRIIQDYEHQKIMSLKRSQAILMKFNQRSTGMTEVPIKKQELMIKLVELQQKLTESLNQNIKLKLQYQMQYKNLFDAIVTTRKSNVNSPKNN